MTWVIGGRSLFCARCLADVQATLIFENKPPLYIDAIQKVHRIGPDLVVAFADSVRLGFYVVEKLKYEFYPKRDRRLLTNARLVLQEIYKYLQYIVKKYNESSAQQIRGYIPEKLELMILFQPKIILDMNAFDPEEFPRTEVWKIDIPSFKAWEPEFPFQLLELGSGAVAENYRDIVERHERGVYEIPGENGELPTAVIPVGKVALRWLFAEAVEFQNAGISRAMHICLISPTGVFIRTLPAAPEAEFPSVVNNWKDFKKLMAKKNIRLTDCSATA